MSEETTTEAPDLVFETEPLQNFCSGFKLVGGNVHITFGYAVVKSAVLLMVYIKIGEGEPTQWRRVWAPKEEAVDMAEVLVGDAEEYLIETLGTSPRMEEDLGVDDFLHHLDLRLRNLLH